LLGSPADQARAWEQDPGAVMAEIRKGFESATGAGLSCSWVDLLELYDSLHQSGAKVKDPNPVLEAFLQRRPGAAIAVLAASGALKRPQQTLLQIAHRRGTFETLSGGETAPVERCLLEGLPPEDLFRSCFGARKTLAEKKLLTPKAGDLSRLLLWALGRYIVANGDCGTQQGIEVCTLASGGDAVLTEQRWRDQRTPLAAAGEARDTSVIRSPLGCSWLDQAEVCAACYGSAVSGQRALGGWPAGMLAATTIGERGTQLALRTFHTGGVAGLNVMHGFPRVRALLLGQPVPVVVSASGKDAWQEVADTGQADSRAGDQLTARSLGDGKQDWTLTGLARVFLFEMYSNYDPQEIAPVHFELLLAALIAPESGPAAAGCRKLRVRSLLDVARDQPSPLDALAFGYAPSALRALASKKSKNGSVQLALKAATKGRLLGGMG